MKTALEYSEELPIEYAYHPSVEEFLSDVTERRLFTSIDKFLDAVITWTVINRKDRDVSPLRTVRRMYVDDHSTEYHITYYVAKDLTNSRNVKAFNLSHAERILNKVYGVMVDNIVYISPLNSKFTPHAERKA
jgi:hypothetical protein